MTDNEYLMNAFEKIFGEHVDRAVDAGDNGFQIEMMNGDEVFFKAEVNGAALMRLIIDEEYYARTVRDLGSVFVDAFKKSYGFA